MVTHILSVNLVSCFVEDGLEVLAKATPVGVEVDHQDSLAACGSVEEEEVRVSSSSGLHGAKLTLVRFDVVLSDMDGFSRYGG